MTGLDPTNPQRNGPTSAVASFWARFLAKTGRDAGTEWYDVIHFDDNERDSNLLLALVLDGTKGATASLAWEYTDQRPPAPGDLTVVTDFAGTPRAVIETTQVDVVPFDDVDADFAADEGEGDGSLAHWREVHERYFARECERLGRDPAATMPVVCERFRLVFAAAD